MNILTEALPKEQQRVRELLPLYDEIPAGGFAATMMRASLAEYQRAIRVAEGWVEYTKMRRTA
jgi:hypothetical protein